MIIISEGKLKNFFQKLKNNLPKNIKLQLTKYLVSCKILNLEYFRCRDFKLDAKIMGRLDMFKMHHLKIRKMRVEYKYFCSIMQQFLLKKIHDWY